MPIELPSNGWASTSGKAPPGPSVWMRTSGAAPAGQAHAVARFALRADQLFAGGAQLGQVVHAVGVLADRVAAAEVVTAFLPVQAQHGVVLVGLLEHGQLGAADGVDRDG